MIANIRKAGDHGGLVEAASNTPGVIVGRKYAFHASMHTIRCKAQNWKQPLLEQNVLDHGTINATKKQQQNDPS